MGKVSGMDSRLKKLITGAAVILLLGGASAAALTATGQSHRPSAHAARPAHAFARLGGVRDLGTAASYLGISTAQLAGKLSSGQSLAEIAAATPGRSVAGLLGRRRLVGRRFARPGHRGSILPAGLAGKTKRRLRALSGGHGLAQLLADPGARY